MNRDYKHYKRCHECDWADAAIIGFLMLATMGGGSLLVWVMTGVREWP